MLVSLRHTISQYSRLNNSKEPNSIYFEVEPFDRRPCPQPLSHTTLQILFASQGKPRGTDLAFKHLTGII